MKRTAVLFLLRLSLGAGIFTAIFQVVGIEDVLRATGELSAQHLVIAVVLSVLGTIVVPAIITRRTLKVGGLHLGLLNLVGINLAMRFYTLTLPHAVTVAMRWYRYRGPNEGKGWEIAAVLMYERVNQLLAVVGLAFIFLLASYATLPIEMRPLIILTALASIVGCLLLAVFLSEFLFNRLRPILELTLARTPKAVEARLKRLLLAICDYHRLGRRNIGAVFFWTLAWYLLLVSTGFVVSEGLGAGVSFAQIGWIRSVVFLLTLIPITVGGLGVREAGFAFLLSTYGVDDVTAVAFPLVLFALSILIGAIGAALEIVRVAVATVRRFQT